MVFCSDRAVVMLSAGSDGERVKVVGEDRPGAPSLHSGRSLQARPAQSVAALEVADAALRSGAVAAEPSLGPSRAGLLAPGDEHALGFELLESFGGGSLLEAAIERDFPRTQPEPLKLAGRVRQQLALRRVARSRGGRQDESPRATLGVLRDLADLDDVSELVGLAELALADRAGIGVEHRHQPLCDRLPRDPLLDLRRDALGAVRELLKARDRLKLALCAP